MKSIYLFTFILILTVSTYAQDSTMLLGKVTREYLAKTPHYEWIKKGYQDYKVTRVNVSTEGIKIKVFFGSWCGDTRRELPRLLKVFDSLGFTKDQLELIAVHRFHEKYKQSPGGEHEGLSIYRVPSILVYNDGELMNRITESPQSTLEADLVKIINQMPYQPKYIYSLSLNQKLDDNPKFLRKIKNPLDYQNILISPSELTSYALSQNAGGNHSRAIEALLFNIRVYPKYPRSYKYLGLTYLVLKENKPAAKYFKKYLKLKSDDKDIIDRLKQL